MRERMGRLMESRWFDPALAAVVTAVLLVELAGRPDVVTSAVAPLAAVLLGVPIALRRSRPLVGGWLEVALVAVTAEVIPSQLAGAAPGALIVAYSAGAYASWRAGIAVVVALIAAAQVHVGFADFPNVELAFIYLAPWWVGAQIGRRRRLIAELRRRTAELEAEQDAFARLSVRHERARIAHELHDIVAHHLAVIVVQAGAGRLAPEGASARTVEHLGAIRQAGEQALGEIARLVDILHTDDRDDGGALDKLRILVDEANAAGAAIRFDPLPHGVQLPSEIEEQAYRVVREGLTNAVKHAPGALVQVRLAARGEELEVEVRNGQASGSSPLAATGSGLGLRGMRERVESVGGTLDAGRTGDGGWQLRARLPIAVPVQG